MKRAAALVLLSSIAGCGVTGEPGAFPEGYPHGGTGVFRPLDRTETGVQLGRAISLLDTAVDSGMVADGYFFYAAAPLLATPPLVPIDFPAGEVFWDAFAPRAIFRSAPRDNLGFVAGSEVLTASAAWEGTAVFDPWVVVLDDGTARMYYAADGGIGIADAPSLDGAFTRVGDAPILGVDGTNVPRRPSVVRGPNGEFLLYYEAGGAIFAARSDDGASFDRIDADESTPEIDPLAFVFIETDQGDSEEVSVGGPGAASLITPVGRWLVRLYFHSRRADGTVLAYVAGSADGVAFERHEVPVIDLPDVRFPAPVLLDDRVTLLYVNIPGMSGDYQTRLFVGAVSPAAVRFDDAP